MGVFDLTEELADLGAFEDTHFEEIVSGQESIGPQNFGGEPFEFGFAEVVVVHFAVRGLAVLAVKFE